MPQSEKNVDGLKAYAKAKSQMTINKVDESIQKLIKTKAKINFNSVSIEAGISKAYLYKNIEIRNRIEALRKQQEGLSSPSQVKRDMTEKSKDVLIAGKNKRIKELEEENKRIKEELMRLRGKLYEM